MKLQKTYLKMTAAQWVKTIEIRETWGGGRFELMDKSDNIFTLTEYNSLLIRSYDDSLCTIYDLNNKTIKKMEDLGDRLDRCYKAGKIVA